MGAKHVLLAIVCAGAIGSSAWAQTPMAKPTPPVVSAPVAPVAPTPPASPTATTSLTNINSASAEDLDKLPQIGKVRAASIIKGRPYKATDDLLTKKVLSKGVFEKIKDKITV
jgi:DNA uptake protein ComE-like DNA-binding protein